MAGREFGRQGEEWTRRWGKEMAKERERKQGTGLTYMRWEGLQGGKSLLRERALPFWVIGLEAWARLIHWHGSTGPRRLSPLQGGGAAGVGVVWGAGALINIGWDLAPERGVLALQRLKLEETVSNTRRALSKSKLGSLFQPTLKHLIFFVNSLNVTPMERRPNIHACDDVMWNASVTTWR